MKKSTVLMIALAAVLTSCGTFAQLASSGEGQQFSDGIYSNSPDLMSRTEKAERKAETDALISQTKESPIYLFGDKKDTVMIPENYSATIKYDKQLSSTVVTVQENPYDWRNNLNPWSYYYTPFNIGLSWSWGRYWGPSWSIGIYPSYHYEWYSPYWAGWYDPYYSPWYWSGWYDPYWYGYHHHYCGWYGGWDPHWGHHGHGPGYVPGHRPGAGHDRWYGPRRTTEQNRIQGGRQTAAPVNGRGMGASSNRPRVVSSGSSRGNDRLVSSSRAETARRTAIAAKPSAGNSISRQPASQFDRTPAKGSISRIPNRTTPATGNIDRLPERSTGKIQSGTISRIPAGSVGRVPSSTGRVNATGKPANHRKPTVSAVDSGSKTPAGTSHGSQAIRRSNPTTDRKASVYDRNSSYDRSYNRNPSSNSDSYNRSSSPSRSSGFGSGGGYSRSSFSGGSGHSRSSSGRR